MKLENKIDQYLKEEEELNESYHPEMEFDRFEKNLVNWFLEKEEIIEMEDGSKADVKFVETARSFVEKAFATIEKRIVLVQKHMRKFE